MDGVSHDIKDLLSFVGAIVVWGDTVFKSLQQIHSEVFTGEIIDLLQLMMGLRPNKPIS